MSISLRTFVLGLSLGAFSVTGRAYAQPEDAEGTMLAAINDLREDAELSPLVRDPGLDRAARVHSEDMAGHDMLDHVSPRTGDPTARVRAAGVTATRISENIALGATPEAALASILESAAHRRQILSPNVTHVGIAIVPSARGVYVTQVFAREEPPPPVEAEVPAQPAAPTTPAAPAPPVPTPPVAPSIPAAPAAPTTPAAPATAALESVTPAAPLPTVRADAFQGPTPPPGQAYVAPAAPPAPQGAPAAVPVPAVPPSAQAQGTLPPGAQVVVPPTGARVMGYWVFANGRWWYYPVPPGAHPGQVLEYDPSIQGPPAGYTPNGQLIPGYQGAPQAAPPAGYYYYGRPAPAPVYVAPQAPYRGTFMMSPRRRPFFIRR